MSIQTEVAVREQGQRIAALEAEVRALRAERMRPEDIRKIMRSAWDNLQMASAQNEPMPREQLQAIAAQQQEGQAKRSKLTLKASA